MDLITFYPQLFSVEPAELERNRQTRDILKRFHTGRVNPQQSKPTGDLMVWVHIGSKESGNCVQITVSSGKRIQDILTPNICCANEKHRSEANAIFRNFASIFSVSLEIEFCQPIGPGGFATKSTLFVANKGSIATVRPRFL